MIRGSLSLNLIGGRIFSAELAENASVGLDWDGTSISGKERGSALKAVLASAHNSGIRGSNTFDIDSIAGLPQNTAMEIIKTTFGKSVVEEWRAELLRIFQNELVLMPGAANLIHALHEGSVPVAVISNTSSNDIYLALQHLSISDRIGAVIGEEDVEYPKPDAQPVVFAASDLDKPVQDMFVIGDTDNDVKAALSAGARAIRLVNPGETFNWESPVETGRLFAVNSLQDITFQPVS